MTGDWRKKRQIRRDAGVVRSSDGVRSGGAETVFTASHQSDGVAPIPETQKPRPSKEGMHWPGAAPLRDITFSRLHAAVDDHFEEHRFASR